MRFRALLIWKRAIGFQLSHWTSLLPVVPFLCLPVVGDVLSSVLIRQKVHGAGILPWEALRRAWTLVPRLLAMKIYFETIGLLWALVPFYGILPGIKHRLYWAMASNVLVFEGLSGEVGRNRCRELIEEFSRGLGIRTLNTVPSLLLTGFVIVWIVAGSVFEAVYSYGFGALIFLSVWVVFPASSAVNTFFYLELLEPQA